jgi:peptide-methionine (R)-S-oxide reductase
MSNGDSTSTDFDLTRPADEQVVQLASRLKPEEAEVLLDHDTEAPFCGA